MIRNSDNMIFDFFILQKIYLSKDKIIINLEYGTIDMSRYECIL